MADTSVGVTYIDIVPRLIGGFSSKLESAFGASMSGLNKNLAKTGAVLTATVTAPIVAVGTLAVKSFEDAQRAVKQLGATTGLQGKVLHGLAVEMRRIYSSTVFDYPAIEAATAKVVQRFDLTGVAAGRLTRLFLALGRVTGEDVPTLIDEASKALAAFNIPAKRTGDLVNYIFKVSQRTGIPFLSLTSGALSSQVALQAMHLSLKESVALIAQLDKAGVASPSAALKGVGTFIGKLTAPDAVLKLQASLTSKEASLATLRAKTTLSPTDALALRRLQAQKSLSATDQAALATLQAKTSLSASDQATLAVGEQQAALLRSQLALAKAGPAKALQSLFQQIKNAPTRNDALGLAQKAFGSRTGGQLVGPIRQGDLNVDKLVQQINKDPNTIGGASKSLNTFADQLTIVRKKISVALEPLGKEIVKVFKSLGPQIKDFAAFIKGLAKDFGNLSPDVKKMVVVLGLLAAALGPVLVLIATFSTIIEATTAPVLLAVVAIAALVIGFAILWHKGGPLVAMLGALGAAVLAFGLSLGPIAFTVGSLELPLIAVAAVVLALGAAFFWVATHTKVIGHAFGAVKVVIGKVIAFVIGVIITLVKRFKSGIDTLLSIASHLPFVGSKFAALKVTFDKFSNGVISGLKNQQDRFNKWKNTTVAAIVKVTGTIQHLMVTMKQWNKIVTAGLAQTAKAEGIISVTSQAIQRSQIKRPEQMTQAERRQYYAGNRHAHAAGGFAEPGEMAWVGEQGPELAVFGEGARIIPNNMIGAARSKGGDTYHFHIKAHDAKAVAREVHKILNSESARQGDHSKWRSRNFVG